MKTERKNPNMRDCEPYSAGRIPGKITASKAARAAGAIIFFGIPAVTLTTALLGYGIRSLFKRIKQ
jgi:hypothetical protein